MTNLKHIKFNTSFSMFDSASHQHVKETFSNCYRTFSCITHKKCTLLNVDD